MRSGVLVLERLSLSALPAPGASNVLGSLADLESRCSIGQFPHPQNFFTSMLRGAELTLQPSYAKSARLIQMAAATLPSRASVSPNNT